MANQFKRLARARQRATGAKYVGCLYWVKNNRGRMELEALKRVADDPTDDYHSALVYLAETLDVPGQGGE